MCIQFLVLVSVVTCADTKLHARTQIKTMRGGNDESCSAECTVMCGDACGGGRPVLTVVSPPVDGVRVFRDDS